MSYKICQYAYRHLALSTHFLPSILNLYLILLLSLALRLSDLRTDTHRTCFEKHKFSISNQSKFAYSFLWYDAFELLPLSMCFSAFTLGERSNIAMPFKDIATYTSYTTLDSIDYAFQASSFIYANTETVKERNIKRGR